MHLMGARSREIFSTFTSSAIFDEYQNICKCMREHETIGDGTCTRSRAECLCLGLMPLMPQWQPYTRCATQGT
jgi:hypothetical protein